MAFAGSLQSNASNQMAGVPATPREPTATEAIQSAVMAAGDRLVGLRTRLADLSVRSLGGQDEAKTSPGQPPRPVPNGNLSAISMAVQDVCALIEDCHAIAARLDRIA